MELVKIEKPVSEFMDNSLTEKECDKLYTEITDILNSDKPITKAMNEAGAEIVIIGAGVGLIIGSLMDFIKNKYSINVRKLLNQTKELNDIYTKVDDMLKHDKIARFKHRNDMIPCEVHKVIMRDNKTDKNYDIELDFLAYDIDKISQMIEDGINQAKNSKTRKKDLEAKSAEIVQIVNNSIEYNHLYIRICSPMMQIIKYKSKRLEDTLMIYKDSIGACYININAFNETIGNELAYVQMTDKAYKQELYKYSKDKDAMALIDNVFKAALKNITLSMNFNSAAMDLFEKEIRYYTDELTKIYDIIRS